MAENTKIERARGVTDVLPYVKRFNQRIESQLHACFESFGYQLIDVPILEHTDLYLRKSGEETISRLYDFTYRNRRLSLRPEMTASIMRAFVDNMQDVPLPVRLCFSGPVFRYEKPQKGRQRQFTQLGVELIGADGPMADSEVIYTACKGLENLGIKDYRVVLGHVGILGEFLDGLTLTHRTRSFLHANMENLRRDGIESVTKRLNKTLSEPKEEESSLLPGWESEKSTQSIDKLSLMVQQMNEAEARFVILDLLDAMNIDLNGTREPEDIVDRLIAKIKRKDQTSQIDRALDFMSRLGNLTGEPFQVLSDAEELLFMYDINPDPLKRLRSILEVLQHYDLDWDNISLDLGLSRGLQYYTGMIFEIHHDAKLDQGQQLCGGGRYDDLISSLGGQNTTPAAGFSFGLERIRLAMELDGIPWASEYNTADVLVIPVSSNEYGYAIKVSEVLRSTGLRTELDVRNRSVKSNLQHANKQDIPYAIIVGSTEEQSSSVVLKNLRLKKECNLKLGEAAIQILAQRVGHEQ